MLIRAKEKIAIEGKYTNEANKEKYIGKINNQEYINQIIYKII